jgi:uroporphyrinogen-III synthase
MQEKTVAILESRLGSQLAELIARRGWRPLCAPALAEIPDIDQGFIAGLIEQLAVDPPKLFIFQTGVGTQALFQAADALGGTDKLLSSLASALVAARGPKPSGALRARGVRIDRSAADPFTTHEVLDALRDVALEGQRVIVQRYGAKNTELEAALIERGARLTEIPTYRWAVPTDTAPLIALMDALARREVDATVFTSASQAQNLFSLAATHHRAESLKADLNACFVASIGPVCTAALKELGLSVALEASPPKLGPLLAALEASLGRA